MLHKEKFIIVPETFALIRQLQALPELKDFYLVGGTALALQLGHRNSVDIDLFSINEVNASNIKELMHRLFEDFSEIFERDNTLICLINNIKTDFIRHNYPVLFPVIKEEGISMLAKEDIAAMKIHAIIQSGKRLKDFIDIYYLLEHFSLSQMIDFFSRKYTYTNPMIALKALNYFGDIDENIDPPKTVEKITLQEIIKRIQTATVKSNKVFK